MDEIHIEDPELIPEFLTGSDRAIEMVPPRAEVWCCGMPCCRIADGEVVAVACDHPHHGCHPRHRERYARVRELMGRLGEAVRSECPKCGGNGWLDASTAGARHAMLLSLMMGMWRGNAFRPRRLRADQTSGMVQSLLASQLAGASSSGPGGIAALARAFSTNKGEEDGDGDPG